MVERNAEVAPDKRIKFRIGIHLGDVVEESDGDLMGDGVNIAARLEGVAKPGAICLSEQAYWQVKGRLGYPLSLRNVEDLLAERRIDISHETVRFWWNRFGPIFRSELVVAAVYRPIWAALAEWRLLRSMPQCLSGGGP